MDLNKDIIISIMKTLSEKDLLNFSCTCKELHRLAKGIWEWKFKTIYNSNLVVPQGESTSRIYFIETQKLFSNSVEAHMEILQYEFESFESYISELTDMLKYLKLRKDILLRSHNKATFESVKFYLESLSETHSYVVKIYMYELYEIHEEDEVPNLGLIFG